MYYREWASKVNFRKGRMVTLEALKKLGERHDPGYCSVYMFREADALEIKARGTSAGMNQYPVAAEWLTIDIDTGEAAMLKAEEVLKARGLMYEIWESGGKGYHIHIPHELIESTDLPYSHLKAVEALGIEHDKSLYQHGRLISMPGRIHPKTKKRKTFLRGTCIGELLQIELVKPPYNSVEFNFEPNGGLDELSAGLIRFANMLILEPDPGNRHTALWGSSKDLAEAGLSYDTVLDIALGVNRSWRNPKAEEEVILAVSQAFQR